MAVASSSSSAMMAMMMDHDDAASITATPDGPAERTALEMATQFPKHTMNTPTDINDWKYEMRREAQEILPRLYVGPYQSSRSLEALQALGITHIVCLSESRERNFVKPRFPDHFVYLPIELRDAQDQNLIRLFPTIRDFIDNALQQGGKVLVHCGDGISRSPAIVVAYVMVTTQVPHEDAFQYVQARRFCVAPNANFQRQIEAYEDMYRASLSIAHFNQQIDGQNGNGERKARRKRTESSQQEAGDTGDSEDEELKERNLLAQRRRNDGADQMAQYIGDTDMH